MHNIAQFYCNTQFQHFCKKYVLIQHFAIFCIFLPVIFTLHRQTHLLTMVPLLLHLRQVLLRLLQNPSHLIFLASRIHGTKLVTIYHLLLYWWPLKNVSIVAEDSDLQVPQLFDAKNNQNWAEIDVLIIISGDIVVQASDTDDLVILVGMIRRDSAEDVAVNYRRVIMDCGSGNTRRYIDVSSIFYTSKARSPASWILHCIDWPSCLHPKWL